MVFFFVNHLEAGDYGAAEPYDAEQEYYRPEEHSDQQHGKHCDNGTNHAEDCLGQQCLLGVSGDKIVMLIVKLRDSIYWLVSL